MTDTSPHVLVLAGTGKTGRRVAARLRDAGAVVRTAARSGADVRFDWDDPATFTTALADIQRVYLVPPNTLDFAAQLGMFLDAAASVRVDHVTYLSARGVDHAPAKAAMRAVELHLMAHDEFGWTILRPAWFMQNFSEGAFLPGIVQTDQIVVPAGKGAESFISADDIAAVAATTLMDPAAHRGTAYTITGSEALTFADVAAVIAEQTGREITYVDTDHDAWIQGAVASGVPAANAALLGGLFDVIRSGAGAATTSSVEEVLGHPPISFAKFASTVAPVWDQE